MPDDSCYAHRKLNTSQIQRPKLSPGLLLLGSALLLAAIWLGLLNQLRVEWTINPQYNYGWGVPLLGLYLLAHRWPSRPAAQPPARPLGAALLAGLLGLALLPIRLFQEANPDWRLVSWSYSLVVIALTLLAVWFVGGRPWLKHFCLPVAFLLVAVPWPSRPETVFTESLMQTVAALTVEGLNWYGILARQQGNLIELTTGLVGINEACSGVRSFQSTIMIALFLGELHRFSILRRTALLLAGLALAFVLNLCRAFWMTWLCARNGTNSLANWHDPAGYIIFGFAFAGLLGLTWLLRKKNPPSDAAAPAAETPAASWPRPLPLAFLALFAAWLATVEIATESWYRSHERHLTRRLVMNIQWPAGSEKFRSEPLTEDVRRVLRCTTGEAGLWQLPDGSQWSIFFFQWSPGRAAAQLARNHSPEICLPAAGLKLVSDLGLQWVRAHDVDLPFHAFVFESRGRPLYVFFCLWEERTAPDAKALNAADYTQATRVRAVQEGRRHLGQQVLELAISGVPTQEEARRQLEKQLQQLVRWSPDKS